MDRNEVGNGGQIAYCVNCGAPIEADMKFCVNCGMPVVEQAMETVPEPLMEAELEPLVETVLEPPMETEPEPLVEIVSEPSMEAEPEEIIEAAYAPPIMPAYEPVYQSESYAPTADLPFPDAPVQTEMTGYRQEKSAKKTGGFVSGILGFVVLAALLVSVIVVGLFTRNFMSVRNLSNIFGQLLIFGSIACGVVLTSRAKGPDLSMGALMALTGVIVASMGDAWIVGLVVTLLLCASIGAINGIFIVFLRIPSLIMTIVVSIIVRSTALAVTNGVIIRLNGSLNILARYEVGDIPIVPLAIFSVAFVLAFLMVLLSRLGKPLSKREVKDNRSVSYFVAYLVSSLIAFLVGVFLVSTYNATIPNVGLGYELFIILCFAAITSSRFLDNKVVPVLYVLAVVLLHELLVNVMMHLNIGGLIQIVIGTITLGFVVISYIARKDSLKGLIHRV